MNRAQFFPAIIIFLSVCSALVYAVKGDLRHALYWFSAATLNAAVTF